MSSDEEEKIGFIKRIALIPCMRQSLMYGISSGLGLGLGHFLFTSNVARATKFGFGSYIAVLLGTWSVCRYQTAQARFKTIQMQKAMSKKGSGHIQLLDPKDV